jgi:hypothetical protein
MPVDHSIERNSTAAGGSKPYYDYFCAKDEFSCCVLFVTKTVYWNQKLNWSLSVTPVGPLLKCTNVPKEAARTVVAAAGILSEDGPGKTRKYPGFSKEQG